MLCTHHHLDHVQFNQEYQERFGCPICGHAAEEELFGGLDQRLQHDEELVTGALHIRALHIPGHTLGQLAFLVNEERVFTGDTLFRRSVGGTRAPGHGSFAQIQHSLMEVLMKLPKETVVHPGHTEPSSIGEEWEENPFIRMWRGLDQPLAQDCSVFGEPATLLLEAVDYDGGSKCWVQFKESQEMDLVPGSKVKVV